MSLMDLAGCMAVSPERKVAFRSKEELRREAQLYVASNFVAVRLASEEDKIATFDKGLKSSLNTPNDFGIELCNGKPLLAWKSIPS